jgi:hypothetical protein
VRRGLAYIPHSQASSTRGYRPCEVLTALVIPSELTLLPPYRVRQWRTAGC